MDVRCRFGSESVAIYLTVTPTVPSGVTMSLFSVCSSVTSIDLVTPTVLSTIPCPCVVSPSFVHSETLNWSPAIVLAVLLLSSLGREMAQRASSRLPSVTASLSECWLTSVLAGRCAATTQTVLFTCSQTRAEAHSTMRYSLTDTSVVSQLNLMRSPVSLLLGHLLH